MSNPDWPAILLKISKEDPKVSTRLKNALAFLDDHEAAGMSADDWAQFPNVGVKTVRLMIKHAPHLAGTYEEKARRSKSERLLIRSKRIERKVEELLKEITALRFDIEDNQD